MQSAISRTLCCVTLRLYDTAARSVREFSPIAAGKAALYLCGATVQAPPHIGHVRSGIGFDILVRWLRATGYQTTFCRNVTDIDDKIIRAAAVQGVPWWLVALIFGRDIYILAGVAIVMLFTPLRRFPIVVANVRRTKMRSATPSSTESMSSVTAWVARLQER